MSETALKRFAITLFVLGMVMGPGPGLRLINPDPSDPDASFIFLGVPTLYAWGLFWYFVQLVAIIIAYKKLWRE